MENEVLGMYELQLVNNGCLAEYSEDYKVFVDSILLDSETLKKLNSDENVYTDIIDVEFSPAVKKVDRVDTLVAVTSGLNSNISKISVPAPVPIAKRDTSLFTFPKT